MRRTTGVRTSVGPVFFTLYSSGVFLLLDHHGLRHAWIHWWSANLSALSVPAHERFERTTGKVHRGHLRSGCQVRNRLSSECRKGRISLAWLAKTTRHATPTQSRSETAPSRRRELFFVWASCSIRRCPSKNTSRWSNKRVLLPSETTQICQTLAFCWPIVSRPGARIDPV